MFQRPPVEDRISVDQVLTVVRQQFSQEPACWELVDKLGVERSSFLLGGRGSTVRWSDLVGALELMDGECPAHLMAEEGAEPV